MIDKKNVSNDSRKVRGLLYAPGEFTSLLVRNWENLCKTDKLSKLAIKSFWIAPQRPKSTYQKMTDDRRRLVEIFFNTI